MPAHRTPDAPASFAPIHDAQAAQAARAVGPAAARGASSTAVPATRRQWLATQLALVFAPALISASAARSQSGAGTGPEAGAQSQSPSRPLADSLSQPARDTGAADAPEQWLAAWAAAERDHRRQVSLGGLPVRPPRVFNDQTVRICVQPAVGGRQWRVRLSNRWALEPLVIDSATLGLTTGGAALSPRAVVALRFDGAAGFTLAPGATRWSDPVRLPVRAGQRLALSFHLARPFALAAGSPVARDGGASWVMPGDQCQHAQPRDAQALDWAPVLSGLDTLAPREARLLVAFGDSLTEAAGATDVQLSSYPQRLATRLQGQRPMVSVLNAGLAGNRLLRDIVGDSALKRFDRDVLQQSGVTHALVLLGINDIGFGTAMGERSPLAPADQIADAPALIAGLQQLMDAAQPRGVKLLLGTLMPFGGAITWSPDNERKRQAVNRWIRGRQDVAAVVDFDAALRDPEQPQRLRVDFDSGDHLHPSAAGLAAMADAVDLAELRE